MILINRIKKLQTFSTTLDEIFIQNNYNMTNFIQLEAII